MEAGRTRSDVRLHRKEGTQEAYQAYSYRLQVTHLWSGGGIAHKDQVEKRRKA